ncbi:TetR/AcrR family transcriptional regulator [Leptospira sp. 'Mane']|uniref:TetR/AcrR family transcriptional regulator n=1 Tax=Leptospira sp. 'Mane' TaxID=3387407 RepID=UPI00398B2989
MIQSLKPKSKAVNYLTKNRFLSKQVMVKKADIYEEELRKKEILEAALDCFLQFGYSKTSMDDIAKKAGLSRPLLYLKFKNKEDLFTAIFLYLMEGRYEASEEVLKTKLNAKEKLIRISEILLIEPWAKVAGHPMTSDYYEACSRLSPKVMEKYERFVIKSVQSVLGDKETAEIFFLAMDGMSADLPSVKILKRRMEILIDKFV